MIDNSQLGFLVSDAEKNIVLYTYQPEARESCGGQRLMRKADFHLGQHASKFFRIRCKLNDVPQDRRQAIGADKRHINMFGKSLKIIIKNMYRIIISIVLMTL